MHGMRDRWVSRGRMWARSHTKAMLAGSGALLCLSLLTTSLLLTATVRVHAQPDLSLVANAACSVLARQDPTASNGSAWGRTILSGHNSPSGWFGVDVCSNGFDALAPNPANVSCDAVPSNWTATGCAPGRATRDGFGLTFQCVELVIRFSAWAYGDKPSGWSGNAPDLWLPANHPRDFVMYPNGSSHAPVPGDIIVWGYVHPDGTPWPVGPDGTDSGHVAVVAAVRNGQVITAEQNVKWGADDHPTDRLALTKSGHHWILSGTNKHVTTLPTYRWQTTMGVARATYGWLHSTKNTGTFPTKSGTSSASSMASAATPKQASGGLPSLAPATVITSAGTLADLTWATNSFLPGDPSDGSAHAAVRNLGAPSTSRLVLTQTPATVVLPDGRRYTYAIGTDGHLYTARTAPQTFGVAWFDHGTPPGVRLLPNVSATTFAGGMAIAALGSDGNLWWRAGPVAQLGNWLPLGRPANVGLSGTFAIVGAPGDGAPLAVAAGSDGMLYERIWQPAVLGPDGTTQVPAGWSDWLPVHGQPAGLQLSGRLVAVSENADPRYWIAGWPDTPLDLFALDDIGRLWRFRSTSIARGWTVATVPLPSTLSLAQLVSAVTVKGNAAAATAKAQAPTAALLHLYATSRKSLELATFTLPTDTSANGAPLQPPEWTALPLPPSSAGGEPNGLALAVGPAASVLVGSAGNAVLLGGAQSSVDSLAASAPALDPPAKAAHNPWRLAGRVAPAMSFSDPLTGAAIDARWNRVGTRAQVHEDQHGVALAAQDGAAVLLQNAPEGNGTTSVTVTLPAHPAAGMKAGLVLYLDDGDWLTLTVDRDGQVGLCGASWNQATPCVYQQVRLGGNHTITLRVVRTDAGFEGQASLDGAAWRTIGAWVPTVPTAASTSGSPSATAAASMAVPTPTATTTPGAATSAGDGAQALAPIAFSECGLIVSASSSLEHAPVFTNFAVELPAQPTGTTAAPGDTPATPSA
ncbi:MAG TPA: CHAP domain-containing protein [Ktedonobacterales bacterium]|nr:CHAP domain-containing protein [Ktedonobacterales bacterium]